MESTTASMTVTLSRGSYSEDGKQDCEHHSYREQGQLQ